MYPKSLENLIESFKTLPGIGAKTAERLAFALLELDEEQINVFSDSMIEAKNKIHRCSKCNMMTDEELCFVCNDIGRKDSKVLCVVEDPKNVFLFEKLDMFRGKYHVLEGLISPLDGINPEDIGLDKLLDRIKEDKFEEIIFAFKPSIEGETTALYIKKILEGLDIKITKLASGVPIGADMEYVDSLTLERALSDRKVIE
ncbi:MAG: recombination protein RecR [Bacilli bacterium]|nr:recombination protein RecR [Bacilli bacterium]MBQ6404617.1 recombination protein RecR [Bacilli bacterium]